MSLLSLMVSCGMFSHHTHDHAPPPLKTQQAAHSLPSLTLHLQCVLLCIFFMYLCSLHCNSDICNVLYLCSLLSQCLQHQLWLGSLTSLEEPMHKQQTKTMVNCPFSSSVCVLFLFSVQHSSCSFPIKHVSCH